MDDFNADDVQREVTDAVIYTIKTTPELHSRMLAAKQMGNSLLDIAKWYAEENDDMFGDHLVDEIEMADWAEVRSKI